MKRKYPVLDLHCDSLTRPTPPGESLARSSGALDFDKMERGGYLGQLFAIFFPDPERQEIDDLSFFLRHRDRIRAAVAEHSDRIALAKNAAEIAVNRSAGKMSALLSVEDARLLAHPDPAKRQERLELFGSSGVCAVGLCWNRPNGLGYPASPHRELMSRPLTPIGREMAEAISKSGMLVDASHLSDGGFADLADLLPGPFIASHSGCRALCDHPRNLTDGMLRTLADHGGVAGVNFYPPFVSGDKRATLERLTDHILHMIAVGGEELPALGSDFDGFECPSAPPSADRLPDLTDVLARRGLTPRQIDRITHGNALRVLGG